MPKSSNQKLKLLYLLRILQKETDEEHYLNSQQLIERLEKYDISAERKSIYDDIARLTDFGYDIIHVKTKGGSGYYMGSREFELAELKLLVDVVQASRFITLRKSRELINKLEQFVSGKEAQQLQRQVYVAGRVKTDNESIIIMWILSIGRYRKTGRSRFSIWSGRWIRSLFREREGQDM